VQLLSGVWPRLRQAGPRLTFLLNILSWCGWVSPTYPTLSKCQASDTENANALTPKCVVTARSGPPALCHRRTARQYEATKDRGGQDKGRQMRHKLDLRGNALDSLNEGLRRYEDGHSGEVRAYKFAVLHTAHAMELLLKFAVASEHPLLIYRNPSSSKGPPDRTIGLRESIQVLRNAGHTLDEALVADLEWLRRLRNDIEHYEFDLDVLKVRASLGRILRSSTGLMRALGLSSLRDDIDQDCRHLFDRLQDEYAEKLANARADAERLSDEEEGGHGTAQCSWCGERGTAYIREMTQTCLFCGEEEELRRCVVCDGVYPDSDCVLWNDEVPSEPDHLCTYCEQNIFGAD